MKNFEDTSTGYCVTNNSVKTHVNLSDFFEKLGFLDKIFSKETILFFFISKFYGISRRMKCKNLFHKTLL